MSVSMIALATVALQSAVKIPAGIVVGKSAAIASVVAGLFAHMRSRRGFKRIEAMNERELRDIGLEPGDVHAVRRLPLSQDPTMELASIVYLRRHNGSTRR